jgi:hypothetical protein
MNTLIIPIALWLSANFDLPTTKDLPNIEYASSERIHNLRYRGLTKWQPQSTNGAASRRRQVVSVYVDAARTIYLHEDWKPENPTDLSVLVHELVHHLQNAAGQIFACPQEREELAYTAQDQWLKLFGRNLMDEFELDPFTLLVATKCVN